MFRSESNTINLSYKKTNNLKKIKKLSTKMRE